MTETPEDGYVKLALAVLLQAKQDAVNGCDSDLWTSFEKQSRGITFTTESEMQMIVAKWVADSMTDGRKAETT